jgi:radical SAM superfamily enzyme YgiQ (UPF0313 family)
MKVLLISPNVESLPDPVFPIGLAHIAAVLKRNRIPYQVLDLYFARNYETAISSAIADFQPDLIGLSLRNVDNVSYPNYISYLSFYQQVVQTIRKQSRSPLVLGGSGFSLAPKLILEYVDANYGIVGEGELALVRLIDRLRGIKEFAETGMPTIFEFDPATSENLDSLPIPDRSKFDNTAYLKWGGMGNIQTKRGCAFKCIYCTYPIIEGKKSRLRSPKRVCDEIEIMLESGINNIFFVDNTFNYPIEHAQGICQEIIRRKLPIKWSCYANPAYITPELIAAMLSAGCTGLDFGSDAANNAMLANLGKNFSVEDLIQASKICSQLDISFCHSLLLGGPGETMETVCQTFDTIQDISPTAAICMIGIRVFPKTRLSRIAMAEGLIRPGEDYLKPVFYLSPGIKDDILLYIEQFSSKNPTWIFPGLNININEGLQQKLRRFGIKGPLWEHMKIGEKFRKMSNKIL